jgi:tRNA wybutosine-synthesizing protein 1
VALEQATRELLENQGYRLVGGHSGVKLCHWTKQDLAKGRGCYKAVFYGIESHRCMQMTPTVNNCNLNCLFCWRDQTYWGEGLGDVDDPDFILDGSLEAQRKLLSGFKGHPNVPLDKFQAALQPKHVAISLTGEPTLYPRLAEFIAECHARGMTTFLVTNGTNPRALERLDPLPTQLYVTVAAPNEEVYNRLMLPNGAHAWHNLLRTLELLPSLDTRKVIRHTLVDGHNLGWEGDYAALDAVASTQFIECKGYAHVGASRDRLTRGNMSSHLKIREFAQRLVALLGYDFRAEVEASRVVLLTKPGVDPRLPPDLR